MRKRPIIDYTYLAGNNPSEETMFGSKKIKEQHEIIKLQKEDVMLS